MFTHHSLHFIAERKLSSLWEMNIRGRTCSTYSLFCNFWSDYDEFPGGKLLVPYSILEKKNGAFVLAEITKLALEATKDKKAIEKFFSKQRNKSLLIYIFGNFIDLNFHKDNGLFISSDSNIKVLDEGFNHNEWLILKNLCKL